MRSLRSLAFLRPAKAILVPGMSEHPRTQVDSDRFQVGVKGVRSLWA
jgi:hypothetical protein